MKIKGLQDTIAWYDRNATLYSQNIASLSNPDELKAFTNLLSKNAMVLDAGCGSGRDTDLLSRLGVRPIGLDLSHGLIEVAQKQFPGLKFIEGDMRNLPFSSEYFDGVWAHASLVHFETITDVRKSVNEFYRVIKLDGILHVKVKSQTGKNKTTVVSDSVSKHDRFFRYFTKNEVKRLLHQAGFEPISIEEFKESDKDPTRRHEVSWIVALARKK